MKKLGILIFILSLCWTPLQAYAAEAYLVPNEVRLYVGDAFQVNLEITTNESINAVEGELRVPSNLIEIQDIRDGDSVVNFWLEKSADPASGLLKFSGITPGGFLGPTSHILTFTFIPKEVGTAVIDWNSLTLLKNDGIASKASVQKNPLVLNIISGDSAPRVDHIRDNEPPEDFSPMITHDVSGESQATVIVFSTQDKGSGIASYAVREYWIPRFAWTSRWYVTQSPYTLRDQKEHSYIDVKAIDYASNVRIATVAPSHPLNWYEIFLPPVILLLVTTIVVRRVWRKKQKRS